MVCRGKGTLILEGAQICFSGGEVFLSSMVSSLDEYFMVPNLHTLLLGHFHRISLRNRTRNEVASTQSETGVLADQ